MKVSYLAGAFATSISVAGNVANANVFRHQSGMHIGLREVHHSSSLERRNAIAKRYNGWGTFDQLLDHGNPELGTFQQRFWYGTEYWKGPGSPVIVINAGEDNAEGYNLSFTTNYTLPGRYAVESGAAIVIVEHRYWGGSSPFDVLTVENLTYLTLENSLKDMIYFAKHFVPPFDPSGNSSSDNAPWIYMGGSYPGAIAHWLATLYPGEGYWAYHAMSAVVQAVGDFHKYFDPVLEYMPGNCSKDVTAVIDHVDKILLHGTAEEKLTLKKRLNFEGYADADFAWALAEPLLHFQSSQFTDRINAVDFFCGFIEITSDNGNLPGAEGVGLEKALDGYAQYMNFEFGGSCDYGSNASGTHSCWDQFDVFSKRHTDLSVDNLDNRQWMWMLCNEPFEWWQTSTPRPLPTPKGSNGVISRLLNYDAMRSRCAHFFPPPPGIESLHNLPVETGGGSSKAGNTDGDDFQNDNSTTSHLVPPQKNPRSNPRSPQLPHLSQTPNILLGKTSKDVNAFTHGWDLDTHSPTKRLMHSNGALDPWRDATLASHVRPGGPVENTPDLPHFVVPGGTHCSDLLAGNWLVNQDVARIVDSECETMSRWIGEFYDERDKAWPGKHR